MPYIDKNIQNILEFLENEGVAKGGNLSPFLKEIFGDQPDNVNQINFEADRAKNFLERLEKAGLIKILSNPQDSLGGLTDSGYTWFDTLTIWAHINLEGINWLNRERLQIAENNLRSSVINTNRLSNINIGVTLFLGGLIFFLQIESNSRDRRREKRETLQQQQSAQEQLNRKVWERQLDTFFFQLNQSLSRIDTGVKKVKIEK